MEYIQVTGGIPLEGELRISGAKNSVLPLLAATLLFRGESELRGCPKLTDVDDAVAILRSLGCKAERIGDTLRVDSHGLSGNSITKEQMCTMRSSILFLGPLLARTGMCRFYEPGGCCLGARPIDMHLGGLKTLGAEVFWEDGGLTCCGKLKGGTVVLPFPSVGATENLILAAIGAEGVTIICNAAREPEIGDLIGFLSSGGARIYGTGTSVLEIHGGFPESACYKVMPDRMEAATYLSAAAATGGLLLLRDIAPGLLQPVLDPYRRAGCVLRPEANTIFLRAPHRMKGGGVIKTSPYPGFPTDAQAPVMAAFLRAEGVTVFEETVFSDRYRHVPALREMGGKIETISSLAVVTGVEKTLGTKMEATDLRGGAAMVIAALGAEGDSFITGVHHIHRGYGDFAQKLSLLGADIQNITDEVAACCREGIHYGKGAAAPPPKSIGIPFE